MAPGEAQALEEWQECLHQSRASFWSHCSMGKTNLPLVKPLLLGFCYKQKVIRTDIRTQILSFIFLFNKYQSMCLYLYQILRVQPRGPCGLVGPPSGQGKHRRQEKEGEATEVSVRRLLSLVHKNQPGKGGERGLQQTLLFDNPMAVSLPPC